jgi:hypothetical protein
VLDAPQVLLLTRTHPAVATPLMNLALVSGGAWRCAVLRAEEADGAKPSLGWMTAV